MKEQVRYPFFDLNNPELEKSCIKLSTLSISEIEWILRQHIYLKGIHMGYTHWCNNIGHGIYHVDWQNYHWLEGIQRKTSQCYNEFAIRYDITTPKEQVIHHGAILLKRHANRYLRTHSSAG